MLLDYHNPTRLYTGEGCVLRAAALLKGLGPRCLIVTGGSSAQKSGALSDVYAVLEEAKIACEVFSGVEPNPSVSTCGEAAKQAKAFGASFILGIGGGSALDAAKAVAALAANDFPPDELFAQNWPKGALPIITIGTTAGTGSEVTAVTVLKNSAGQKTAIKNDLLYPRAALGDPRYTHSVPYDITVSTALDALAHAIESWFNRESTHISGLYARATLDMLYPALQDLARGEGAPITPETREALYYASVLAGFATARTGTSYPHRFSYFLTEEKNLPHGTACCVFLPAFLRRVSEKAKPLADKLCAGAAFTPEELAALTERLNVYAPFTLTPEETERMIARAEGSPAFLGATPPIDAQEARALIQATIHC